MADIVKICKIHGELTIDQCKTGIYRNRRYIKCRPCEVERSRRYMEKKYADPAWVEKKHEYDKKQWQLNKDYRTEQRRTPEAIARRRAWFERNKQRGYEYRLKKQKEYRETLHDHYVNKNLLTRQKGVKFASIPKEITELKRILMLINREIKKVRE
jgi:hypothetical protein